MRRRRSMVIALTATLAVALVGSLPLASARTNGRLREYVVQYEAGVSLADGRAAVKEAGGTVVDQLAAIGVARVVSRNGNFILDAAAQDALAGAGRNRVIGYFDPALREKVDEVEALGTARRASSARVAVTAAAEPLADLQWGMDMIGATAEGSHAVQPGDPDVLAASSTPVSTGPTWTSHRTSTRSSAATHDGYPARGRPVQPGARPLMQRSCGRR